MNTHVISPLAWERMVTAVEKVRQRLRRASQALEQSGIPYAVIGGNAVAAWVSEVDEAAVRNTRDVDILLRRTDLERAKTALAAAGFIYRHSSSIDMFLDGPGTKARDAVHVVFAGEKIHKDDIIPAPEVEESKATATAQVINLEALLRMKLVSFRRKDQMHLLDLIDVGLIDASWVKRLPKELGARLQELLDNPEG
ncbi:MAG TPA: nucleotidyltransferase family protein [Gemmataceae bacterium]|nr:nucleotidyltransferase family protein [Gemmataceae bacterium]